MDPSAFWLALPGALLGAVAFWRSVVRPALREMAQREAEKPVLAALARLSPPLIDQLHQIEIRLDRLDQVEDRLEEIERRVMPR